MRRGGGSKREVRNELLACFSMYVLKNNVGWPHWPLRQQPISGFPGVGMLPNPPRLSILTRRADGGERGMRDIACFVFVVCLAKLLCDNIQVGS
jgi:hypothetical protein